jgi:hypothetical protein
MVEAHCEHADTASRLPICKRGELLGIKMQYTKYIGDSTDVSGWIEARDMCRVEEPVIKNMSQQM